MIEFTQSRRRTLILASASPRRRELLEGVGIGLELAPVDIDESWCEGEDPRDGVRRLAREKVLACQGIHPDRTILGADTIVWRDGRAFGKPSGPDEARQMLENLSGQWHEVITAVALLSPEGALIEDQSTTRVRLARLVDEEITRYLAGKEPWDKAGAYAIQGAAGWFVESIEGSASNVVGLPLETVRRMFQKAGLPLPRLDGKQG